jgi:Ankyrin repeats (many copies)
MSMRPLPAKPSLDHLRQQARALQRSVRAGDPAAAERLGRVHQSPPADPAEFAMSAALLTVAREYGFPSWARLRRFVELSAGNVPRPADPLRDVADEFCRLACITYTAEDDPERWERAQGLLADHPRLTRSHIWAAAAATQPGPVGRLLDEEPGLARLPGGPYGWSPLFYLACSRVDGPASVEMVLATARLLLYAGADPNEKHHHPGLPHPLTVLTGVFGGAEDGTERQPAHPYWDELAGLLLISGADANDPQALRNRMFRPSSEYLEVLLGQGRPGARYQPDPRPGDPAPQPIDLWRIQLRYAVEHDLVDRVRLLVSRAVDHKTPYPDGHTPFDLALARGSDEVARYLVEVGIEPDERDLFAAVYEGDFDTVERLVADHPDFVKRARHSIPNLIALAVSLGSADMIPSLARLGFDLNATNGMFSSQIAPALHQAATRGDLDLARLMLSLGADPNVRDAFGRTALDHARDAGHDGVVALLDPPPG